MIPLGSEFLAGEKLKVKHVGYPRIVEPSKCILDTLCKGRNRLPNVFNKESDRYSVQMQILLSARM